MKEVKVIEIINNSEVFENEVQSQMDLGYKISSTNCDVFKKEEGGYDTFYQAILVKA